MVDKICGTHRLLAELCNLVDTNSHFDKQSLKKDIENKKKEITAAYSESASTQRNQGWWSKFTSGVTFVSNGTGILAGNPQLGQLGSEVFSQFMKGCDSYYNADVSSRQGLAQLDLQVLQSKNSTMQDGSTTTQKVHQIFEETLRRNEQSASSKG